LNFLLNILTVLCFFGSGINQSQTLNYYFGNLHSHSGYSDGNKDSTSSGVSKPAGDYSYAKLSQNFDFLGISEHNHFSSKNNPGMIRTSYALGLAEAAAANTGTFLCLYGTEWGVNTTSFCGHVVIYGFNQLIGWETSVPGLTGPNYDIFNDKSDYVGLFSKVKNNPNAFCYLAHPSDTDYGNISNIAYSSQSDSAIVGSVFRNGLAFSSVTNYTDYPATDYLWYYRKMLAKGYHIGITYDHDNHNLTFGRNNGGRLVIMAPTLTEPNLYSAMKNMHFYASEDWNCHVDFKINTSIIGDSTSGSVNPTINVTHNDLDGELADSIKVWSGVEGSGIYSTVLNVVKSSNTLSFTDNSIVVGTNKYYFIEIVQPDGNRIITSPIWYKLSNFSGIKEYKNDFTFLMFPNPVNTMLYISTNLNEDFDVEIYDVTGKMVHKEKYTMGNIKISTEKMASGFYSVKISSGKFTQTKKLVIE
jgi:hypothetical protein